MMLSRSRSLFRAFAFVAVAFTALSLPTTAKAASGWTTLEGSSSSYLLACKYYETGGYGPVWRVHMLLANGSTSVNVASVKVTRYGNTVGAISMYATPGQWVFNDIYASQLFPDLVTGGVSFFPQSGTGFANYASTIGYC